MAGKAAYCVYGNTVTVVVLSRNDEVWVAGDIGWGQVDSLGSIFHKSHCLRSLLGF